MLIIITKNFKFNQRVNTIKHFQHFCILVTFIQEPSNICRDRLVLQNVNKSWRHSGGRLAVPKWHHSTGVPPNQIC